MIEQYAENIVQCLYFSTHKKVASTPAFFAKFIHRLYILSKGNTRLVSVLQSFVTEDDCYKHCIITHPL